MIRAIRPTGATDMGGGQQTEVDVTIAPDRRARTSTTVTQSFLRPARGLGEGGAVTVKYDPDNQSAALIYGW